MLLSQLSMLQQDVDLVIVGAQRLGRREKLFGSFTRQLARQTSCPIIVMSRRG